MPGEITQERTVKNQRSGAFVELAGQHFSNILGNLPVLTIVAHLTLLDP